MHADWLLRYFPMEMAGVMGLAPTSSTVTGWILVSAKLAPADGIAPPTFRLTAGGSTVELRGNMNWSARSDLHAQGCLILSQVGLLFPVNHAPKSWRSWRDSHPLEIRFERATARRLCAQEQLTLGRDGRSRADNLLDVTEPLC
jgi:hypothetical protein